MARKKPKPDPDRPMNEAEWERFLQESDARAAKYGELLETLMDDPNRDEIIDHEMGWDDVERRVENLLRDQEDAEGNDDEDDDDDDNSDDDERPPGGWLASLPELTEEEQAEIQAEIDASDRELEEMPVYREAMTLATESLQLFAPLFERNEDDEDRIELLQEALSGATLVAAKITGSHAMGYEDDALCGAIVVLRKALAAAEQCHAGLEALKAQGIMEAAAADHLLARTTKIRPLLEHRIADLRSRVWW